MPDPARPPAQDELPSSAPDESGRDPWRREAASRLFQEAKCLQERLDADADALSERAAILARLYALSCLVREGVAVDAPSVFRLLDVARYLSGRPALKLLDRLLEGGAAALEDFRE